MCGKIVELSLKSEEKNWESLIEALSGKEEAVSYVKEYCILPACEKALQNFSALGEGETSYKLADKFWDYLKAGGSPFKESQKRSKLSTYIAAALSTFLSYHIQYEEIKQGVIEQNINKQQSIPKEDLVFWYRILSSSELRDILFTTEEQKFVRLLYLAGMSPQEISEGLKKDIREIEKLQNNASKRIEGFIRKQKHG